MTLLATDRVDVMDALIVNMNLIKEFATSNTRKTRLKSWKSMIRCEIGCEVFCEVFGK